LAFSLIAETDGGMVLGGGGLGRPGYPASKVGQSAAEELIESCSRRVCLDTWAQDQVQSFPIVTSVTSFINVAFIVNRLSFLWHWLKERLEF
jgi:RNA 3'-terminal phosphate cyclase (ATP)